jgi:hypothetical protein
MQNDIIKILIPLILIFGGLYVKKNPDKEPFASKNTWKILVIIGLLLFVLRIFILLTKNTL